MEYQEVSNEVLPPSLCKSSFQAREGRLTFATSLPDQGTLTIPENWRELDCNQLVTQMGIIKIQDAGFPFLSHTATRLMNQIRAVARDAAEHTGYLEVEQPLVINAELLEKSGVMENYREEMIQLQGSNLLLSPTSEESLINFLKKGGIQSYKQLPSKTFHMKSGFRDIKRARGFYSTKHIQAAIFTNITENKESYIQCLKDFSAACELTLDSLGIPYQAIHSDDQMAVEYFYQGSCSDREISTSVAHTKSAHVSREVQREKVRMSSLAMAYPYKHTEKMALELTAKDSSRFVPLVATCGIGLQRVFLALFDVHRDEHGIRFPDSAMLWDVSIVPLSNEGPVFEEAKQVADTLTRAGMNVLLDDRAKKSLGEKLSVSDFYGVRYNIIIGKQEHRNGELTLRRRGAQNKGIIKKDQILIDLFKSSQQTEDSE